MSACTVYGDTTGPFATPWECENRIAAFKTYVARQHLFKEKFDYLNGGCVQRSEGWDSEKAHKELIEQFGLPRK